MSDKIDKRDNRGVLPPHVIESLNKGASLIAEARRNPEKVLEVKRNIYERAMGLALDNPSEFKVDAGKNSYYSAMFDTSAEITTPYGIFYLTLSMVKKAEDETENVRRVLLTGPDGMKHFFRMDVKTGKDVDRDVVSLSTPREDTEVSEAVRLSLADFFKSKIANVEGIAVAYDTFWAETEISDESALRLLKSVTKVNTHPRYAGKPTLLWVMNKYKEVKKDLLKLSSGQTTKK